MRAMCAPTAVLAGGATAMIAIAVPALAATTVSETLTDYKIAGASSAKSGSVTFKVKNAADDKHELIVINTATKAGGLEVNAEGEASEKGRRGRVTVAGGQTKALKLTLAKGHYALICNIGDHYTAGMRKDFSVR